MGWTHEILSEGDIYGPNLISIGFDKFHRMAIIHHKSNHTKNLKLWRLFLNLVFSSRQYK